MPSLRLFLASAAMLATAPCAVADHLPVRDLLIGSCKLTVEVAQTERQMERGLMKRRSLPENSGMLFSFKAPRRISMWMKDTWIPLDAAFVDECGKIVRIASMEPLSITMHDSIVPVMNVIETNVGWFKRHDLQPGALLPDLVTPYCQRQ